MTVIEGNQASTSEKRRERERLEMTERILDAARELCLRKGYKAVTLRKVAEAIEYSPAAIYQYYENKKALVAEIIRKDAEDFRRYMLEDIAEESPIDQLLELARRYVVWGTAHPKQYILLMSPPPGWIEETWSTYNDEGLMEREVLVFLTQIVAEVIKQGLFKDEYTDPSLVVAILRAGVHGFVLLETAEVSEETALLAGLKTPFEARINMLVKVFLDGLLKNPKQVISEM